MWAALAALISSCLNRMSTFWKKKHSVTQLLSCSLSRSLSLPSLILLCNSTCQSSHFSVTLRNWRSVVFFSQFSERPLFSSKILTRKVSKNLRVCQSKLYASLRFSIKAFFPASPLFLTDSHTQSRLLLVRKRRLWLAGWTWRSLTEGIRAPWHMIQAYVMKQTVGQQQVAFMLYNRPNKHFCPVKFKLTADIFFFFWRNCVRVYNS